MTMHKVWACEGLQDKQFTRSLIEIDSVQVLGILLMFYDRCISAAARGHLLKRDYSHFESFSPGKGDCLVFHPVYISRNRLYSSVQTRESRQTSEDLL